jgi:primosomal protein N' (replication factor Y)
VGLVYHRTGGSPETGDAPDDASQDGGAGLLRCHFCDHKAPFPASCPECKGPTIRFTGKGTQRVVGYLKLLFPSAKIFRWDRDSTQKKHGHSLAFGAVSSEDVDIVVGTRMVSQGLHFPRMTLVGVLEADRGLLFPDFRSAERTFQLLTQVSGRAGRAGATGEVYLQARQPDHYSIAAAAAFDYQAFVDQEMAYRRDMFYPPFSQMIQIRLRGKTEAKVEEAAEALMSWVESQPWPPSVERLGPAPCFHQHAGGDTLWQVMIKGPEAEMAAARADLKNYKPPSGVTAHVDVDPEDLL